jgi:hypothetical protein
MSDHLPYQVTVRFRSGRSTIKRGMLTWNAINDYVRGLAVVEPFPRSTVMTVKAAYGEERFSLRGGGNASIKMIKLTGVAHGLPANEAAPKPSKPVVASSDDPGFVPPRSTA